MTEPNPMNLVGYREIERIGEGSIGNVFRAVRESTGGVVAIKELRDIGMGSPVLNRARRELDALLQLKGHPYVVSVEEIIEGPRGPCLVMEFAAGGSLIDRLSQSGTLPVPELVLIGQHATQALGAAHDLGIVHRDVKPHNLLIGKFGQVKVCDFGIAALTRDSQSRTRTRFLTLAYASPEELEGADEIGPPADAFSLGATFVHLATGHQPSAVERTEAGATAAFLDVDPSSKTGAVFAGIRRCLSRDPEARPSMSQLLDLFDEAASQLGELRLQRLTVPEAVAHDRPHLIYDEATVVRPRPESASSGAAGGSSPPPAWVTDPSGRHQLRYWNGTAWTEHVSNHGQTTTDPPTRTPAQPASTSAPPPEWFTDPTGRHQLRYWNGTTWTEHVSNHGQTTTDPPNMRP